MLRTGIPVCRPRQKSAKKIDVNPLLPFTYDDSERIIPLYQKTPLELFAPAPEARCDRRVSASSTLNCHFSDPAQSWERGLFVDMRELKSLEIAARSKITFDGSAWLVPSQTTGGKYRVGIGPEPSCECEDFSLRKAPCKHVIAARLVCERDHGGKAPEIVTDAVPRKPTYQQDWPRYDLAQITEKRRFLALLYDLCGGITEPPQPKTGRKRTLMADMVFASVLKVYTTLSSRRFGTDLEEAHKGGFMSRSLHPVTVCAFLEDEAMTPFLRGLIMASAMPLRTIETAFAVDSSGFSVSKFVRWHDEKYGVERSGRDWVKVHLACGVKTHVVTAAAIYGRDANDCPILPELVNTTAQGFTVKEVSGDKGYLSAENVETIFAAGGMAFIAPKSNTTGGIGGLFEKMFHYYQFRREEFLRHYHQRSNIESVFSMIKRKFGDSVRSKTETAMANEVYCKLLAHNICCVHHSHIELGIEPVFWPKDHDDSAPAILPLKRPG
jgi:transposase